MNTNDLKLRYYRSIIIQTKRGSSKGLIINAKPIFLLSLFDLIEQNKILNNRILFEDNFKAYYEHLYAIYEPKLSITPFYKPFYHLQTDGYWHIQWGEGVLHKCISAKYLRENIEYACLDNALWDLLQDGNTLSILRETVVNYFLKNSNNK